MLNRLKDALVSWAANKPDAISSVFSEQLTRIDFESELEAFAAGRLSRNLDNRYLDEYVETLWQGWLFCAKRHHRDELTRLNEKRISDLAI